MFNTEKKRLKKLKSRIEKSGLFDNVFYLRTYPDIRLADMTPLEHYVKYGIKEDRKPNKDFDPIWYRNYYIDVKENGTDSFSHYILFGKAENRFQNANMIIPTNSTYNYLISSETISKLEISNLHLEAFDENYYLENNADLQQTNINLYEHYITFGWREGRNPNDWFNVNYYLNRYIDIKNLGFEPLRHYLEFGKNEGRITKEIEKKDFFLDYNQLLDFGYSFYGPILGLFFQYLNSYVLENNVKKLYFLAREGYFLKKIYDKLSKKDMIVKLETEYLLVSRAFLFRLLLKNKDDLSFALQSNFSGTIEYLLKHRFSLTSKEIEKLGFTEEELELNISLPDIDNKVENLLVSKIKNLQIKSIEDSYEAYEAYLNSINFLAEETTTLIDLGYAGTIQKILAKLFKKDINGVYFVHSNKSEKIKIGDNICNFKASFKSGVNFGDGYSLLEKSLVLEGLLTSPHGQLKNMLMINKDIKMIYGMNTISQKKFQYLETIIQGATNFIEDMNNANIDLNVHIKDIEKIFDIKCNSINHEIMELIELDDHISGYNIVNPSINI